MEGNCKFTFQFTLMICHISLRLNASNFFLSSINKASLLLSLLLSFIGTLLLLSLLLSFIKTLLLLSFIKTLLLLSFIKTLLLLSGHKFSAAFLIMDIK